MTLTIRRVEYTEVGDWKDLLRRKKDFISGIPVEETYQDSDFWTKVGDVSVETWVYSPDYMTTEVKRLRQKNLTIGTSLDNSVFSLSNSVITKKGLSLSQTGYDMVHGPRSTTSVSFIFRTKTPRI